MTIIIEGITPTEYITAINDNFTALNVLTENLASLTTCTVNMLSRYLKTEIDNNNAALNVYPYVPKSLSVITIGTKGSVFASRLNANVISLETELNLVKKHVIGSYGCYGMPTITEDPLNPGKYIMIGQKFSGPLGTPLDDGDIYYSIFDLAAHSFTVPETVLDAASDTLYQGHAIWGYWNGKYHFAWAQSSTRALTDGTLVAIESATWQGFKNHVLLDVEPAITNELGWEPWFRFLSIDANTVWIVYSCHISGHIYVAYTIWDSVNGWDKVEHKITVTDVVSADETYAIGIGSFLKEGNNLFLYYLQKGL